MVLSVDMHDTNAKIAEVAPGYRALRVKWTDTTRFELESSPGAASKVSSYGSDITDTVLTTEDRRTVLMFAANNLDDQLGPAAARDFQLQRMGETINMSQLYEQLPDMVKKYNFASFEDPLGVKGGLKHVMLRFQNAIVPAYKNEHVNIAPSLHTYQATDVYNPPHLIVTLTPGGVSIQTSGVGYDQLQCREEDEAGALGEPCWWRARATTMKVGATQSTAGKTPGAHDEPKCLGFAQNGPKCCRMIVMLIPLQQQQAPVTRSLADNDDFDGPCKFWSLGDADDDAQAQFRSGPGQCMVASISKGDVTGVPAADLKLKLVRDHTRQVTATVMDYVIVQSDDTGAAKVPKEIIKAMHESIGADYELCLAQGKIGEFSGMLAPPQSKAEVPAVALAAKAAAASATVAKSVGWAAMTKKASEEAAKKAAHAAMAATKTDDADVTKAALAASEAYAEAMDKSAQADAAEAARAKADAQVWAKAPAKTAAEANANAAAKAACEAYAEAASKMAQAEACKAAQAKVAVDMWKKTVAAKAKAAEAAKVADAAKAAELPPGLTPKRLLSNTTSFDAKKAKTDSFEDIQERLQNVHKLYKDGLIDKKQFETKQTSLIELL
jgi:hypothetical protein